MNYPNWERIWQIELQVESIDSQIARLQRERRELLDADDEYAAYVAEHEASNRASPPMSIREYYKVVERLLELNKLIMDANDEEFMAGWRKHRAELERLERAIFA